MVTASYGHHGQRAARIGPDRVGRIRLPASFSVPFFQRRHGTYCAKPTRIRYRWPGQGLATLIWSESKPVCRFQAGRNRPATSFPLLNMTRFRSSTDVRIILCETSPDPIYFWLIVPGFGQTDPVRKKANVQVSSGLLLASASQLILPGCESDPACLLGNYLVPVCAPLKLPCQSQLLARRPKF